MASVVPNWGSEMQALGEEVNWLGVICRVGREVGPNPQLAEGGLGGGLTGVQGGQTLKIKNRSSHIEIIA